MRPYSIASEVLFDDTTNRASGVRVIDANTREVMDFKARVVVLGAGTLESTRILFNSKSRVHPNGLGNSSGLLGRSFMMHNNAHIAAVDVNRHNDVVFQKTVMVTDWYHDGGDGHPLGTVQTIGKVQGLMMKSWATRVPLPLLDAIARRLTPFPTQMTTRAPDLFATTSSPPSTG